MKASKNNTAERKAIAVSLKKKVKNKIKVRTSLKAGGIWDEILDAPPASSE